MYLAIDIGGTKTLLAVFDEDGQKLEDYRFPTDKDYSKFLKNLATVLTSDLKIRRFKAVCVAIPGQLDPKGEVGLRFGNLAWQNVRIKHDVESLLPHTHVFVQNDAKLAGLYEALEYPKYKRVLYLTISTGIGAGWIVEGQIDKALASSEPGQMMLEFRGRIYKWEDLSSGRALVTNYGKRASEIDEPAIWKEFSAGLARGINELIATLQPDAIIMGGGVGAHLDKFLKYLQPELAKLANAMVPTPPIIMAKKAEEAVIYGCYEYAKQNL